MKSFDLMESELLDTVNSRDIPLGVLAEISAWFTIDDRTIHQAIAWYEIAKMYPRKDAHADHKRGI